MRISSTTLFQQRNITAGHNTKLSGKTLNNQDSIQTQGELQMNMDTLTHSGQLLSGRSLALSIQNAELSGLVSAHQDLTFSGNTLHLNLGGQLLAGRNLNLLPKPSD